MKKTVIAALAIIALVLGAFTVTPAIAEGSVEQQCAPGTTVTEYFKTDPGAPWVATGASQKVILATGLHLKPVEWLTEPPDARDGWVVVDTRTRPGTGTSDVTERVLYTWTGGPSETHPVDSPFWNETSGESQGGPHDQPDGVPYQTGGGNSPWFIWKTVVTEGTPAVTEYKYELKIPDKVGTTYEYVKDCPVEPPVNPETPEVPVIKPDPVVETETKSTPHQVVKIQKHASGKVTKKVINYPVGGVEEGM